MNWHQKELKAILAELDVPVDGLSSEEAGRRLAKYGRNELVEKGKRSLLAMIVVAGACGSTSGFGRRSTKAAG